MRIKVLPYFCQPKTESLMSFVKKNKFVLRLMTVPLLFAIVYLLLDQKIDDVIQTSQNADFWVDHSKDVLLETEQIHSLVRKIDNEAKEYVVTGNKELITSLPNLTRTLTLHVQNIRLLTADNQLQQMRVTYLNDLLVGRIKNLESQVVGKRKNIASADNVKDVKEVFIISDTLEATINHIQEEENRLLQLRMKANEKAAMNFKSFFKGLTVAIALSLMAYFVTLWWILRKEQKTRIKLADNNALLDAIIDNTSSLIYIRDLQGRMIKVNKHFEELSGIPPQKIIGKSLFDLYPEDLASAYASNDERVLSEGRLIEVEEEGVISNGRRSFLSVKFPWRKSNGSIQGIIGISTDITDVISRKQLEHQRHIAETTLEAQEKQRSETGREFTTACNKSWHPPV